MLKKETKIKWHNDATNSFTKVKKDLTTVPILISLDFTKKIMILSFASDHTI